MELELAEQRSHRRRSVYNAREVGDAHRNADKRCSEDADEQRSWYVLYDEHRCDNDANHAEQRCALGHVADGYECGSVLNDDAGVLQSDEGDEESDASADSALDRRRNSVDDERADACEREHHEDEALDEDSGERELLISCYRTSLMLAKEYGCESAAFPLISSGIFGYPKDQALKVAIDTISSFLLENEMTVYIVIFDRKAYQISGKLFADIAAYIDDRYVDEHTDNRSERLRRMNAFRMEEPMPCEASVCEEAIEQLMPPVSAAAAPKKAATLDDALGQIDESFSEMLLRKIDERGMTDAQCYKKANIDRKLFSKIRSDKSYKPSKPTVIAFAIALELPLVEMKDMLMKAGFALSHSNKFDIIVEYFVEHGNYNVFEINEALFAFDQSLIGA